MRQTGLLFEEGSAGHVSGDGVTGVAAATTGRAMVAGGGGFCGRGGNSRADFPFVILIRAFGARS